MKWFNLFKRKPKPKTKDLGQAIQEAKIHFARLEDQKKDSLIQWLWNHSRGLKGHNSQLKKMIYGK